MKKSVIRKRISAEPAFLPDISGLITAMREQLAGVERKLDTLISRSSERPIEAQRFSVPPQRFDQSHRRPEVKQENNFRERVLHKAICADCNKSCDVPFKPTGDRPVYCKECFAKRKTGGQPNMRPFQRPPEPVLAHARPVEKVHVEAHHKPVEKKKAPARKKKK